MKKAFLSFIFLLTCLISHAQFTIADGGTLTTCSGTLSDSGGANAPYSNNESHTITLCPDTAGQYIQLDFTSFEVEGEPNDFLTIYEGTDTTGAVIAVYGNNTPVLSGGPFGCDGFQTGSSDASGCMTLVFVSNGTTTFNGWNSNISCTTTPGGDAYNTNPVNGTSNSEDGSPRLIAGGVGSPGVPPAPVGCEQTSNCSGLQAFYDPIRETTDYTVTPIAYNPPYRFDCLQNQIPNTANVWSNPTTLPFNFCYYGNTFTNVVINPNGAVSFDNNTGATGTTFTNDLPDASAGEALFNNTIYAGYEFLSEERGGQIGWEIINVTPNSRALVVSWNEVPISTSVADENLELEYTGMIVLYEGTNIIETHIKERTAYTAINNGRAIIGIQNEDATMAQVAPGRNTNDAPWTVNFESWRFSPSGNALATSLTWYEGVGTSGTNLGTTDIINVCPSSTTDYTAEITFTRCDGSFYTTTAQTAVTINPCPLEVEITGTDDDICSGTTVTLTATPTPEFAQGTYSYSWFEQGNTTVLGTNNTLDVTPNTTTTYEVIVMDSGISPPGNMAGDTFDITVTPSEDASFNLTATCSGATVDSIVTPGGTFTFNPAPTDAATIDSTTGEVTNVTGGTNYTVQYTTTGVCPGTNTETFTALVQDDASFTYASTCAGNPTVDTIATPGGTFTFNPVPTDGATIDSSTGTITNGVANTTYTVDYTTNGTCPATASQMVTIIAGPTINNPTPLQVCDDNTPDGFTSIDLSVKNAEISGGDPNLSVTYYINQADADAETNPLMNPYTNISNPQTVYVRVEDVTSGCYSTTTLELQVEQAPTAFNPTPLEFCDQDNDGFGVFTLSDADAEITNNDPNLSVTYFETQPDAENNVNPLASPYNNIVVNMQTVYARIENNSGTSNCASFVTLELIVNPTPQIIEPTPLEVCDNNTDGFAVFDLTTKNTEILNGLDPTLYTVTFYTSQANAEAPSNAIVTPNAYTNTTPNMQTVWVRVEDNANGCFKVRPLDLIVNSLPVLMQPAGIELCNYNDLPGETAALPQEEFTLEDANAEILNGQTGITLSFHSTQNGADTDTDEIFSPYTNTANTQTVFVRAENGTTGCVNTITLDLSVNPLPSPAMNEQYIICDTDNDGITMFDLDSQTATILNGESGVTLTYHETEPNANAGINALTSPYENIVAFNQIIYVRAENTGSTGIPATGCFSVVTLELIVSNRPEVPLNIPDYILCDDDMDGFTAFDFDTVISPVVYGSQSTTDFTLTYHVTLADAEAGNNPITNTSNYTNTSSPQIIYIRLEDNNNSCFTTGAFNIEVALPPVINPNYDNELTVCDDLDADYAENNDGFTTFDLTSENSEINNGNNSWFISFFESDADAQNNVNAIPNPENYTNISNATQTIHVSVTDNDSGCVSFTTLTIRVLPNPSPTPNPDDLELCDDTNSGDLIEIFDLTQNEATIINGETGVTASYYTSLNDAISGTNVIVDPTMHSNEDAANPGTAINPQTIYVRITNGDDETGLNGTGCFSLVNFDITVNPLPEVPTQNIDIVACELNTDGFFAFDLTQNDSVILGTQNPADFTVTYHLTLMDAEDGMNALPNPYTNVTNPQEIFVNVTNTNTGCINSTLSFFIEVNEDATINNNMPTFEVCDDNIEFDNDTTNDTTTFDLSTQDNIALNGQDPASYTVTYYANQADADAFVNQLPTTYQNATNPQIIIVRVDNDTMGIAPISLDLSTLTTGLDVDGDGTIDTIDTDADGVFDIVDVDGDGIADGFDTDADGILDFIDIDGDGNGDLVDLNNDGEVDNSFDTSSCYQTTTLELEVNPLPVIDLDDDYLICIDTNGSEVIANATIDSGLSASEYSFEWVEDSNPTVVLSTASSFAPTFGGSYTLTVTNNTTTCQSMDTTIVEVSAPPTIDATITSAAFADEHKISVTASGSGISIFEFSLDGGSWEANEPNDGTYIFENVSGGTHTITVRDINGCGETSIEVTVIDYPLYFTPNGDSYNDTWNIYGAENFPDAKIYIFDRYGKLLKQLNPLGNGWDGTYNGNPVETNDYWFTIEYTDLDTNSKKLFKSHFTLKR